ncbi:3-dehydroquinate synthase [Clostridium sp. Cult2]|uniref:3-dehydroquinate synthase n=1 Tax=Clostridium sp. Cult2 TaxID=2079003 RepID=UPI001F00EB39|nr:3-dehydroquinate synthase [Clostridium sp. Cult2]MCF6466490.1 3-dehydroquinate synthase [Clostridium sp. Cult2]
MKIKIGKNILNELNSYLKDIGVKNLYIITDENVNNLYEDYLYENVKEFDFTTYVLAPGERSKSIDTTFSIYDNLIENNIDRNTLILSFGGGVVGDITGFVASTFKRGINYIQIPTTLLAQVDSSIGGKVGIDYGGLKNIIGSFYFPNLIIIDVIFLKTLSKRDIISGLGEILKYGLIVDYNLFKFVSSNLSNIYRKDINILLEIINQSVSIKKNIVNMDKYDKGLRRILNFGHTIGHGIEAYYNFTKFNHGETVILGMIYESYIAKEKGLIDDIYFEEINDVLKKLVMPIKFNIEEIERLIKIMRNDKKNFDGNIVFVLPIGEGKVEVFNDIDEKIIKKSLKGEWI